MTNKLFDFLRIGRAANTPPIRTKMCSVLRTFEQKLGNLSPSCLLLASNSPLTRLLQLRYAAMVLFITLGVSNVWGAEIEISAAQFTSITQTISGFSFTTTSGAINTQYRTYANATFSITSSVGEMTEIVMTFSETGKSGGKNALSYTVNPNSTEWSEKFTAQARITKFKITYTPSGGASLSPLEQAANLVVSNITTNNATLSWDAVENASSYILTIGENVIENATSPYVATGLEDDTEYTWSVQAIGDGVNYSTSAAVEGTNFTTLDDPNTAKIVYDFHSSSTLYPAGFPTSGTNNVASAEEFTIDGKSVIINAPTSYYIINSNSDASRALFFGKTNAAYLEFPAKAGYKLIRMVVTAGANCGATKCNVYNTSSEAVSTQITASANAKMTFAIITAKQVKNAAYRLKIDEAKNLQVAYVTLYYEAVEANTVETPSIAGTDNFYPSTNITITCGTEDADVYYTTGGTAPSISSTKYTGVFSVDNTTTIKAIAVKDGLTDSEVATAIFTKITPMTVALAIAAIPNKNDYVDNQYVAGIVCTEGTSVNGSGQMTYYISDDGSETSRLQIYLGKNLGNTAFSATSDLAIGDRVVVFGQLKNFNNTPEMNSGNYLVSKEGPAVATPVFTPDGGGFMGETDVTITCATGSSAIYYTLDGATPTKSSTLYESAIHLDATTTIKAIAYVGEEHSLVVEKTFTLTAPMTVAEALSALDSQDPIENAAVRGIISTAPTSNPSSGRLTYYISDDGEATNELEVFNGFGLNGASFSSKTDLQVGDEVTVFGNLTIYASTTTKEFSAGSRLLTFNRPTVDLESISLPTTANVKTGKTITLTPIFTPVNATDKEVSWSSDAESVATVVGGVVTGVSAGTANITVTYNADPTIKATCTVTVAEAITFNNPNHEWQLVTSDAQLVAGKYYVIGHAAKSVVANNTLSSGYLAKTAVTHTDGVIAYNGFATAPTTKTANEAGVAVFQLGGTAGAWTLTEVVEDKGLLGGAGTTSFTWGTGTTTWPISIDENALATIGDGSAERVLYNNSSPRFKPYGSSTAVSSNMLLPQLYVWAEKVYKLRYDANGGENAPAAQPAVAGEATVTDAKPTYEDHIFTGWNTQDDGNGETKSAGDVINLSTGDVTLYAQWRPAETFTISYDKNGGTLIDGKAVLEPEDVKEGVSYTVKANVYEVEEKVFIGWKAGDAIYNAGQEIYPTANMTFVAQWGDPNVTDFRLVTDASHLLEGDKVYIVAAESGNAMGTQNGTYRNRVEVAKQNNFIVNIGSEPVEFTIGKSGDDFTFFDGENYIAWSSGNSLTNETSVTDNSTWGVEISEGVATIANKEDGTRKLQYNSSSPRFAAYTSTQKAVSIYKKANYTRATTEGRYGTICLPQAGVMVGATLYEVAYYGETSGKIFFDEVLNGQMEAGVPYIFQPKNGASKLAVYYTNDAVETAKSVNGLVGFIGSGEDDEMNVPVGAYILNNNQYRKVVTLGTAKIKGYRSYIDLDAITPKAPALAPGRRRISMSVEGTNTATGVDEVQGDKVQSTKVLINGQLFILRGEKMYDATGRLVK